MIGFRIPCLVLVAMLMWVKGTVDEVLWEELRRDTRVHEDVRRRQELQWRAFDRQREQKLLRRWRSEEMERMVRRLERERKTRH